MSSSSTTTSVIKSIHLSYDRYHPWVAWSIAVSFVIFQLYLQLSSGVLLHAVMQDFSLNALQAGALSAAFYIVYICLQIPSGVMMDRWGPRVLICLGSTTCCIACLLFASSHTFVMAFCARLMMGAGAACAFISTVHIASNLFPKGRLALMVGLGETAMMLGTWLSEVSLAHMLENIHWREAMRYSALIATIIALTAFLLIKKGEKTAPTKTSPIKDDLAYLIRQKQLWANGLYIGFIFSCVTVFASLWCIPLIASAQHIGLARATLECGFIFIGVAIGSPLLGQVFRHSIDSSGIYFIAALASCVLIVILIYHTPATFAVGSFYFFLLGLLSSVTVLNYARASHAVPAHMAASVTGLTNTLALLIIPILQVSIGWLLHSSSANAEYSVYDYRIALSPMPMSLILAMLLCLWRKNNTVIDCCKK